MALLKTTKNLFRYLLKQKTKKVHAATLIESLVASVIIVVVFAIASLTLNNVFKSSIKSNTSSVEHRMNKLEYLFLNKKLKLPYNEKFEDWTIELSKKEENNQSFYVIESEKATTKRSISRKLTYEIE